MWYAHLFNQHQTTKKHLNYTCEQIIITTNYIEHIFVSDSKTTVSDTYLLKDH